MDSLKPCPFCGGEPRMEKHVQWEHFSAESAMHDGMGFSAGSIKHESWELVCACGIAIPANNDEMLAARWNRRVPTSEGGRDE